MTIWAGGRPIRQPNLKKREYKHVPIDPCAADQCVSKETKHYTIVIEGETKEVPLCYECAKKNHLI